MYHRVYKRNHTTKVDFKDFILDPRKLMIKSGTMNPDQVFENIKRISDKEERNLKKRNTLPAVDLSPDNILTIDIDGISDNPELIQTVVDRLKQIDSCFACMESVSGNVVAFFKYEVNKEDYKYLYYKIYLELTLVLGIDIDFLPELNRLRYISDGKVFFYREDSKVLTEILKIDKLPYMRQGKEVKVAGGRPKTIFKSE